LPLAVARGWVTYPAGHPLATTKADEHQRVSVDS
jgi:hypothetical protein